MSTYGLPPGIGANDAGPIGGRRGSYANAARAEYPASPYASWAPLPKYGYCKAGGFTAAFRGAPAAPAEPPPPPPEVGVTGLEMGVLGFSSNFLADGVEALLEVPDLENGVKVSLFWVWVQDDG